MSSKLTKLYFTNSVSWICPVDVENVLVIASGGGGGGASGSVNWGGGGSGGGSLQQCSYVSVSPGLTYTITIGAGGQGGNYNGSMQSTANGQDGYATTITDPGGNTIFYALGGGGAGVNAQYPSFGGAPFAKSNAVDLSTTVPEHDFPGSGAEGSGTLGQPGKTAMMNLVGGFQPGLSPTDPKFCGAGGGAGPQGNGGNGGLGSSLGNGYNANNNTGAGGGGGGNDNSATIGGLGGNGGSGYLYLIW